MLRDHASIVAFLSDQEVDEMQAAIDERREARGAQSEAPDCLDCLEGLFS